MSNIFFIFNCVAGRNTTKLDEFQPNQANLIYCVVYILCKRGNRYTLKQWFSTEEPKIPKPTKKKSQKIKMSLGMRKKILIPL
jgi:hypothetical protein